MDYCNLLVCCPCHILLDCSGNSCHLKASLMGPSNPISIGKTPSNVHVHVSFKNCSNDE